MIGAALGKGGGGGIAYEAEASALFARFTTPPTDERKTLINALVKALKDGGVWSKLDALYVMAAADAQAARRNWIADSYNLTAVSGPSFTTDRGYAGDGSASYLNTNYNPTTAAGLLVQNSAHVSAWSLTTRTAANTSLIGGNSTGTGILQIYNRYTGDVAFARANDSGASVANASSSGHFVASRVDSSQRISYRNGTSLGTTVAASSAPNTGNIFLLANHNNNTGNPINLSSDRIACASIGAGLTGADVTAYYSAMTTYLQAVGAV